MPIDGILFTTLVKELNTKLTNGRVQNVFQPKSDEIVFQIRQPGATYRLLASTHPQLARVHLTDSEEPNPLSPPSFCLLLRKQFVPGRILGFDQIPYERSVTMRVESFGPTGERLERHVIFEVMGRHSNIVLIDANSRRIIDALKRIPEAMNSYREILPHRPYIPPPPQSKVSPTDISYEQFDQLVRHLPANGQVSRGIQQGIGGFSPFAARELLARAGFSPNSHRQDLSLDDVDRLWTAFTELVRAVDQGLTAPTFITGSNGDEFWCFSPESIDGKRVRFDSVNELLDHVFTHRSSDIELEQIKRRLEAFVDQRLMRVERKIKLQEDAVNDAAFADQYKRFGDLITANLFRLGARETQSGQVQVVDYYDDEKLVDIPVDPTLSPNENAQNYYKRYQKARKTAKKAGQHLRESIEERDYLHSVQVAIDSADTVGDLKEIERELQREGYIEAPRSQDKRSKGPGAAASEPLKYFSGDGFTILVGRNNRQNDEITLRRSRPDDLWFHAKEIPGAHVVVITNNQNVPETTIQEAGHLAAYHSKARLSANVPVDYTRCKYVRKPKGAKPGMVIYEQEKTLWITPDETVIQALDAKNEPTP